jgi:hypothetical protein
MTTNGQMRIFIPGENNAIKSLIYFIIMIRNRDVITNPSLSLLNSKLSQPIIQNSKLLQDIIKVYYSDVISPIQ